MICEHPIVQKNALGYYIDTMNDRIPVWFCPHCGKRLEKIEKK